MSTQDPKSSQMTKVKIPYKLKEKFLNFEGLRVKHETEDFFESWMNPVKNKIITATTFSVELNLAGDSTCFSACIEWYKLVQSLSSKYYSIDIGPYQGIYPISIDNNGRVLFHLDYVDQNRQNWKDWFVKEDYIYAPEQST